MIALGIVLFSGIGVVILAWRGASPQQLGHFALMMAGLAAYVLLISLFLGEAALPWAGVLLVIGVFALLVRRLKVAFEATLASTASATPPDNAKG